MKTLKSENRPPSPPPPSAEFSVDFEESFRRWLFIVFCTSVLIPLIIFGIIYLSNRAYTWGISNLLTAGVIIGILSLLRIRRYEKLIYRLSIIIFIFLFTYWASTGTVKGWGSIWFLGTPPYIFFLLGKREGATWGIFGGILLAIIFFNPFSLPGIFHYSIDYSARYLILYFIIIIFIYFYEHTRELYKNSMIKEHHHLLLEKEQLSQTKTDLENANILLSKEIEIRKQVEHDLLEYKQNLEQIVAERTSELREKNIELQDSEKRYRLLADNINDVIWMVNTNLRITYVSPSVQRMLGYTVDEVLHLPIEKFCTPGTFNQLRKFYDETLNAIKEHDSTEERHLNIACKFVEKIGAVIDVEIMLSLIMDSMHQVIGMVGITRDISERIKSQKEKENIQLQLAQSQKMEAIGTLAGGVAHDFNNMLSSIIGYAELTRQAMDPAAPLRINLDRILDAANRSANLTRQLLSFARKQIIIPEFIDINATVESVLKMIRRLIGENIELVWLPGVCLQKVKMDPSQIDQILVNLCVNARDAISGVGKITIETDTVSLNRGHAEGDVHGNHTLLAISDTGRGMDKETLSHIFEPFFTTKSLNEGTGMGLATVYGIIQQNGGMIDVQSNPPHGTTFKIYLPCHVAEAQVPATKDISEIPYGKGETILLVEDDPAILEMGKEMLQKLGYTVIAANTPGKAIQLTKENLSTIHLFITDVIMPEMNGRELIERLQGIRPGARYLYMSGYTSDIIAHQGALEKNVHYLQKPFSLKTLAIKVREAMDDPERHED